MERIGEWAGEEGGEEKEEVGEREEQERAGGERAPRGPKKEWSW